MCKIFLIYRIKHYPEAVKAINGNSIGTRPLSRPRLNDYPRLTSDRTTNPNSNIALKADILLTIPRIQRKISNDDEQNIKDSDHIMRVADSAQGGIACELTFDDLRFSPNNFMSKIDKPTSRVYISAVHGTDRLKVVGNGLDNHKMCLANDKPLLTSSMSARYKPDGKVMIEGKEHINELYNPITTIRTKTPEPIDCEDRYEEPRKKPRTCSTAHAKRYIFSSSLDMTSRPRRTNMDRRGYNFGLWSTPSLHSSQQCYTTSSLALGRDATTTIRGRPSRALRRVALPTIRALLPNAVDA